MENSELFEKFIEKMHAEGQACDRLIATVKGGNNTAYHHVASEAVTLDEGWINTLEQALFSVEKIVKNPRKFIAEEELVVDVERARHTNAKTVRYLSSHSQNIQSITESGDVRPKKLLTTEMVEDVAIYENRFVCTLIQRLLPFVEQRYNDIVGRVESSDQTRVGMVSRFQWGASQVECNLDVKIKEQPHNTVLLAHNRALLDRIVQLRKRLQVLNNTAFMQELCGKKPVRPPIQKTNLIRMNVDYRNCYQLWLYISSYTFVGFSVQFQEKNLPVDGDYFDDLATIAALSAQSLLSNHAVNRAYYDELPYKEPKEKKYRVVQNYTFEPDFLNDKTKAGEEIVNEYYFKRMREELVRATKRGEVVNEKQVSLSFARFFRAIAKINSEMYEDVIAVDTSKKTDLRRKSTLEKKKQAVKDQQTRLKRYRQLSALKKEELERTLNAETREQLKLEKLKAELEKEQGNVKRKKEKEKAKKARLARIKAKKLLAEQKAKQYEVDLREKGAEKLMQLEEQKRKKREAAQRRRDLKRLDELKEKYDGENE